MIYATAAYLYRLIYHYIYKVQGYLWTTVLYQKGPILIHPSLPVIWSFEGYDHVLRDSVKFYLTYQHLQKAFNDEDPKRVISNLTDAEIISILHNYVSHKGPQTSIFTIETEDDYLNEQCMPFWSSLELMDNIRPQWIPYLLKLNPVPKQIIIMDPTFHATSYQVPDLSYTSSNMMGALANVQQNTTSELQGEPKSSE